MAISMPVTDPCRVLGLDYGSADTPESQACKGSWPHARLAALLSCFLLMTLAISVSVSFAPRFCVSFPRPASAEPRLVL